MTGRTSWPLPLPSQIASWTCCEVKRHWTSGSAMWMVASHSCSTSCPVGRRFSTMRTAANRGAPAAFAWKSGQVKCRMLALEGNLVDEIAEGGRLCDCMFIEDLRRLARTPKGLEHTQRVRV